MPRRATRRAGLAHGRGADGRRRSRPGRWRLIRTLAGAAAALGVVLVAATPAAAHPAEAPGGSAYRVRVSGLQPRLPGVTVRAIDAGSRLQLTNHGSVTVEVSGDAGEPYLRIGPAGAYENTRSPSTYRNATAAGAPVPPDADPTAAPQWRRTSRAPIAQWHDRRVLWSDPLPEEVITAPQRDHRLRAWSVPLTAAGQRGEITGVLDWLPPPNAPSWWISVLTVVGLVALLGLLGAPGTTADTRWYGRAARLALIGVAALAGGLTLAYAIGRVYDAGADGPAAMLLGLAGDQVWQVLTGLGALGAAVYAMAQPHAADFALALGGACVGLFGGLANAAVFGSAVAPVPWSGDIARLVVASVTALGLGLAVAGALRLRAARLAAGGPAPAGPATAPPALPGPR